MRQPIFEDEVFVRAFCAVITGRVATTAKRVV